MMRKKMNRALGVLGAALLLAAALPVAGPADAAALTPSPETVTLTIDGGQVVNENFLGVGVNVMPLALMPKSASYGYDGPEWEIDKKRILTIKPKVARLWFQVDWVEKEKGVYDFDSDEMTAVYPYLDALKQAGTEIELNFGWKNGEEIHDWFGLPGVDPWTSAPADVDAFAASASNTLEELIEARGYDNIKYLTFYNEPNGSGDFETGGDKANQQQYYANIVTKVSQRLAADGLRDRIGIWAPEETGAADWTTALHTLADTHIDGYSFHMYGASYESLGAEIAARKTAVSPKPVQMTEFGWSADDASGWDSGFANYVIRAANEGLQSALVWQLNGVWSTDPLGDVNGNYTMWDSVVQGLTAKRTFYSAGLLNRYVPAHSDVVQVQASSSDVRAAAFKTAGGDYAIVVESKAGTPKELAFDFGGETVGKTFYKHEYTDGITRDGNAILPPVSGSFAATDGFEDADVADGYSFAIYTTEAPQTQVKLTPIEAKATGGGTLQLAAEVVDHTGGVTWSVIGQGNGTIDANGLYTAPDVESERQVAIKAVSAADPDGYGIASVTVTPRSVSTRVDAPTLSLPYGVYDSSEAVTIATTTPGAEIRYTLDGSTPTTASPLYERPVILAPGTTQLFKARAFKDGLAPSGVTSAFYRTLDVSVSPDGYSFCAYDGGECYFEGDGIVAYGADGLFNYKLASDGIDCTTAEFGDPNPGAAKRCYYSPDVPDELPTVTFYNAGFEKPAVASYRNGPFTNGWTFSGHTGVHSNTSAFNPPPAPQGLQSMYLKTDSGIDGYFYQEISFKPGDYQVGFKAANRTDFGGQQTFDVYFDDTLIGSFAPSGSYTAFRTNAFHTDGGKHTIKFQATSHTGDNTAFIDAVEIGAPKPPEPPTLLNAGFESPAVTASSGVKPGAFADGWSFNNRAGIQRNGSAFGAKDAPEGSQTALLQTNGGLKGEIKQTVSFQAGRYKLAFKAARRGYGGQQSFDVYFDNTRIGAYTPPSQDFASYKSDGFEVQAAGSHTIRFAATTTEGDNTAFIDDVSLILIGEAADQTALAGKRSEIAAEQLQAADYTDASWAALQAALAAADGVLGDAYATQAETDAALAGLTAAREGLEPFVPALAGGGFESPSVTNYRVGPMTYGWTFNGLSGVQTNGSVFGAPSAPEGVQTALITSKNGSQGELSQTIRFVGGEYKISFQAARRDFGGQVGFDVYYDTTLLASFAPTNRTAFAALETPVFEATAGNHTIRFVTTNDAGDNTAFLDAVALQAIEPPAEPQATDRPGKPALSSDNGYDTGLLDGDYKIAMNLWYGENGTLYKLYENDALIDTQRLTSATPAAQTAVTAIAGRTDGTYRYRAELINKAGVTTSDTLTVTVKDAKPGKPVLSANNWDGDGSYEVTMNMWWGTNAATYRLYENGELIDVRPLAGATPAAQSATTAISGRQAGRYEYKAELVNAAGATTSETLTVLVTHP
ncbi:chitobiase/beta-hexosaminidase C-terminal domain-containing protein [Cohnella sp. 56]|uniref:chitobiase/beta-hexosaminidase C-terminal domain-containing protein n=1 Tax=Cohnella sp. 56 TaxID=3113722 RepID=UPI0030E870EA